MSADALFSAMAQARETLLALEDLLRELPDADLHRAEPEGGWTCAQIVSHIHLCGLLWIADLEGLAQHPGQAMFMFREELGHDAVGAPPPSSREAAECLASLREALERCLPAADPAVVPKSLEGSRRSDRYTDLSGIARQRFHFWPDDQRRRRSPLPLT